MIKMLRLDDRLIHGQIAIRWSKVLGVNMIVVANDDISKDKIATGALKMAAPPGIKCAVLSVEDCIKNCMDPRAKDMGIMVITNNFRDTFTIMKGAKDVLERTNLGNNTILDTQGMKPLTQFIYVSDEDIEICKEMLAMGFEVDTQLRPEFAFEKLEDNLKAMN